MALTSDVPSLEAALSGWAGSFLLSLISLQTQPLRSHALNFLVKRGHFFLAPRTLRPGRVAAAYFFQYFLNGELGGIGHNRTSLQEGALSSDYHSTAIDCRRDRVFG